eukprot:1176553-Prorocentrum_minimum.AAC.3
MLAAAREASVAVYDVDSANTETPEECDQWEGGWSGGQGGPEEVPRVLKLPACMKGSRWSQRLLYKSKLSWTGSARPRGLKGVREWLEGVGCDYAPMRWARGSGSNVKCISVNRVVIIKP